MKWSGELIEAHRVRNEAMGVLRRNGKTLEEIGATYGITRERVRQIVGTTEKETSHRKRMEIKRNELRAMRLPGERLIKMSRRLGINHSRILHLIGSDPRFPIGTWGCGICKRILPLDKFYDDKTRRNGKGTICIECTKSRARKLLRAGGQLKKGGKYYKAQKCRSQTWDLIRRGIVIKTECQLKDDTCRGRIESHHYAGYDHPELVRFYCVKHHQAIDGSFWGHNKHLVDKTPKI